MDHPRLPPPEPAKADILRFLARHPDFLRDHAAELAELDAPVRDLGRGVRDFQGALVGIWRRRSVEAVDTARELAQNGRANLSAQNRVHGAVMALLEAADTPRRLMHTVRADLPLMLGLDLVMPILESPDWHREAVQGMKPVPPGTVNGLLGQGRDLCLLADCAGLPMLFDAAAGPVRSQLLIRLELGPGAPDAMLAFAARQPGTFHPGQATDLMQFLARVLARLLRRHSLPAGGGAQRDAQGPDVPDAAFGHAG